MLTRRPSPDRLPRPDRSADYASVVIDRPRAVMSGRLDVPVAKAAKVQTKPEAQRFESVPWRRAVASLPCVMCGRVGDTQCAHRNEGKGMGLKTDDALTAALCTTCHREIDQGSTFTRDERRERLDKAILLTVKALARAGMLIVRVRRHP